MADQKALSMENLQTAMIQNNTKMKEWVTAQINNVKIIGLEWVDTLPESDISTSTIYLVKSDLSTLVNNIYNEYVYKEGVGWEILGQVDTGTIDLNNYYSKTEIDELLANITITVESYTNEEIIAMVSSIWNE
jgi:hypothetical protein